MFNQFQSSSLFIRILLIFRVVNYNGHCKYKVLNSVARWYILKPKIPIWVSFGRSATGDVGIFSAKW
jgi:hypothetical protein